MNKTAVAKKNTFGEKYPLRELLQGGETRLKTSLSLCYTERGLRVRFEAETGEKLHTPYGDYNDPIWKGDALEFFVSPYGDEKWYFEFDVAPNLSCFYGRIYNPDGYTAYNHPIDDAPVETNVKLRDGLWIAEMEIPFSLILKEEDGEGDMEKIKELPWRFNAYRIDCLYEEYASFAPTGKEKVNFHVPGAFAKLVLE